MASLTEGETKDEYWGDERNTTLILLFSWMYTAVKREKAKLYLRIQGTYNNLMTTIKTIHRDNYFLSFYSIYIYIRYRVYIYLLIYLHCRHCRHFHTPVLFDFILSALSFKKFFRKINLYDRVLSTVKHMCSIYFHVCVCVCFDKSCLTFLVFHV